MLNSFERKLLKLKDTICHIDEGPLSKNPKKLLLQILDLILRLI